MSDFSHILRFIKPHHRKGFTLIQLSVLFTMISLAMVAMLPTSQMKIKSDMDSTIKMNSVMIALRQYELNHCSLPCPADPTLPTGSSNYGIAAVNIGSSGNCVGGSPSAAYADTTNHIAIGMIPVKSLGLSWDYATDGWGRDITYAVDTNATKVWPGSSLPGAIAINDNGVMQNSIVALVSHGQDGYGAWLPINSPTGTAGRLDNGSTDTSQAGNAQVATGGGLTPNTIFTSFTNKSPTTTFDDSVAYKSNQWSLNLMPRLTNTSITYPPNGNYGTGDVLTFTLSRTAPLNVTGTPALDLNALAGGVLSTLNALYTTGSGTSTLTFTYTIQPTDHSPNGIAVSAPVDTSQGTISTCLPFSPPNLAGVDINKGALLVADSINDRIREMDLSGDWIMDIGTGIFGSSDQLFNNVIDIKVDLGGNIWVLDAYNNRIMKFSNSGTWLMTLGGTSNQSCSGQVASSTSCTPLSGNSSCCAPTATYCTCSSGSAAGEFNFNVLGVTCGGLAFDASNNLWVADCYNNRVQEFNSSTGSFMKQFAVATGPNAIAVDSSGNVWTGQPNVSLLAHNTIEKCTGSGVCMEWDNNTGTPGTYGYMAFDANGNLWVTGGTDCTIHEFNSSGASTGTVTLSPALCSILDLHNSLVGIAFDQSGKMWVSDYHTNDIYQINTSTGAIVSTIGTGTNGYAILPIIKFSGPLGIAYTGR